MRIFSCFSAPLMDSLYAKLVLTHSNTTPKASLCSKNWKNIPNCLLSERLSCFTNKYIFIKKSCCIKLYPNIWGYALNWTALIFHFFILFIFFSSSKNFFVSAITTGLNARSAIKFGNAINALVISANIHTVSNVRYGATAIQRIYTILKILELCALFTR